MWDFVLGWFRETQYRPLYPVFTVRVTSLTIQQSCLTRIAASAQYKNFCADLWGQEKRCEKMWAMIPMVYRVNTAPSHHALSRGQRHSEMITCTHRRTKSWTTDMAEQGECSTFTSLLPLAPTPLHQAHFLNTSIAFLISLSSGLSMQQGNIQVSLETEPVIEIGSSSRLWFCKLTAHYEEASGSVLYHLRTIKMVWKKCSKV